MSFVSDFSSPIGGLSPPNDFFEDGFLEEFSNLDEVRMELDSQLNQEEINYVNWWKQPLRAEFKIDYSQRDINFILGLGRQIPNDILLKMVSFVYNTERSFDQYLMYWTVFDNYKMLILKNSYYIILPETKAQNASRTVYNAIMVMDTHAELVRMMEIHPCDYTMSKDERIVAEAMKRIISSPYVSKEQLSFAVKENNRVNGYIVSDFQFVSIKFLMQTVREGNFTINNLVETFIHICEAIKSLHEQGIIHRALNAYCILFKREGMQLQLYIEDFTHAIIRDDEKLFQLFNERRVPFEAEQYRIDVYSLVRIIVEIVFDIEGKSGDCCQIVSYFWHNYKMFDDNIIKLSFYRTLFKILIDLLNSPNPQIDQLIERFVWLKNSIFETDISPWLVNRRIELR